MPKIEHIALWCRELEVMKDFYVRYLDGTSINKYHNPAKGFSSYFIAFEDGSRLELMKREDIDQRIAESLLGWAHIAFSLGSKEAVDTLTERLRVEGYPVVGEPRTTGDGYYESVVSDPEGNHIELTV